MVVGVAIIGVRLSLSGVELEEVMGEGGRNRGRGRGRGRHVQRSSGPARNPNNTNNNGNHYLNNGGFP